MGLIGAFIGLSAFGALVSAGKRSSEELRLRRFSNCRFDNGVSEAEFRAIATEEASKLPRFDDITFESAVVRVWFNSKSGLSTWSARVSFSDYGLLTTDYWLSSNNDDSVLPEVFADRVSSRLKPLIGRQRDDSQVEDDSISESSSGSGFLAPILLLVTLAILSLLLLSFPRIEALFHQGYLKPPSSSESMIGKHYQDVVSQFESAGFSSVDSVPQSDLSWWLPIQFDEGKVSRIQIGDIDSFSGDEWFKNDSHVLVCYHSREKGLW